MLMVRKLFMCRGREYMENLLPSSQFSCEHKTALNINSLKKYVKEQLKRKYTLKNSTEMIINVILCVFFFFF